MPRSVSMTYPTRDENHKLLDGLKGTIFLSDIPLLSRINVLVTGGRDYGKCGKIVTTDTRDALTVAKTQISRRRHRHRR